MKKLISLALMLVVLLCAKPTVYAMEGTEPIEENTLSVKTLGELQSAIASAEDGDEIQVLKSIVFESGEYCVGDSTKKIKLLYENYSGGCDLFVINTTATKITLQKHIHHWKWT